MRINYLRVKIKKSLRKPLTYSELLNLLNIPRGTFNYHLNILKRESEIKSSNSIRNNRRIVIYEKC